MTEKKTYDSTVARIAGNLLSGNAEDWIKGGEPQAFAVAAAVHTARAIVAETERTAMTPVVDELLRRMRDEPNPPNPTVLDYSCDSCGYQSTVTSTSHGPRMCGRVHCHGTESPDYLMSDVVRTEPETGGEGS